MSTENGTPVPALHLTFTDMSYTITARAAQDSHFFSIILCRSAQDFIFLKPFLCYLAQETGAFCVNLCYLAQV